MVARILVVEDDQMIAEMLGLLLGAEGYEVKTCNNGLAAPKLFFDFQPDLVLIDLMLPGMDGLAVCKILRENSDTPIIMLTARSESADVVAGLEAGADDYVIKPFKREELLARVRARLRRNEHVSTEHLRIADLVIDVAGHEVLRGNKRIFLTPLEFDLLTCLARRPWQVFSRDELLQQVWGYQNSTDNRLVNVHVQRLRSKIEKDPDHPEVVLTVRGVGYRAGAVQ